MRNTVPSTVHPVPCANRLPHLLSTGQSPFLCNSSQMMQTFSKHLLDFYLQGILLLKACWKSFWMSMVITLGTNRMANLLHAFFFSLINQKRKGLFWLPCFFITLSFSRCHRVTQHADHINRSSDPVPKLMTMCHPK